MNQGIKATIAVLALALIVLAGFAWWQRQEAEKAKRQLGLDVTRMVGEVFSTKRDLRVGQLAGVVIAPSEYKGRVFNPKQQTRAPVTVNYLLDLRKISHRSLSWNGDTKVMTVQIPDVTVEKPNIDMSRAEIKQSGIWIGRGAGRAMQQQAQERIAIRANERARADKNMTKARQSALYGVQRMVKQPLAAAGMGGVTVNVVFPWEEGRSDEQWDRSRRPEEVLRDYP